MPQFTEVEDKLIGPLSIKQFGIVFFAGILIFAGYSATKSVVALVLLFIIFGFPALALAFAKPNGRPAYKQIPFLIQFFTAPKKMVFHKEAVNFSSSIKLKDVEITNLIQTEVKSKESTKDRIKAVQDILEKQSEEERALAGKIR